MIEQPTRVPAMVTALLARLTEAFDDTGVAIIDGPPLDPANLPADDVLCIGFPGPDGKVIDNTLEKQQGLGGPRYAEVFEIGCVFSTVSGDTDMAARRARCLWAVTLIDEALKADRGLGGVVDAVTVGTSMAWGQEQHPDGATCDIMFSIVGSALL